MKCEHEFLPVFNVLYGDGGQYHGVESTKETACKKCGKKGPLSPDQEIFLIEPPAS